MYTEFSDRSALAPNLAKILLAAERKGGAITIRDAQLAFNSQFRPSAQIAKSWFQELVALGYGTVKKSGKSVIFQNTRRSDDRFLRLPSNPVSIRDAASDPRAITVDQFLQSAKSIVGTDPHCRHDCGHAPPLQGEGSGSIVGTDPDFATSEKIDNQNVNDCVKFVRTAISENDSQAMNCKTATKLKIKFGGRFANNFLLVSIFV